MNKNQYITYSFYRADGRRIAAFAEHGIDPTLKVYLYSCSTKDQFSKRMAKVLHQVYKAHEDKLPYRELGMHPETFSIIVDPKYPKRGFIQYMFENFYRYKMVPTQAYVPTLVDQYWQKVKVFKEGVKLSYKMD